jgi:hypothetical protein
MGRVVIAFRAFFATLFNRVVAERVVHALDEQNAISPQSTTNSSSQAAAIATKALSSSKHEALILLSSLQREARFVDFLKEDLSQYSDEQVGAAVREIHRDAGKVLDRFFAIQSIVRDEEGSAVEVPKGFDAARFRLTGKLAGEAPFRGKLNHHGWEATRCELPAYTGSEIAAMIITPAEIELP